MKKNILLAAVAALALVACTKDELRQEVGDPQVAIDFKTFANKATRGAENSNATASGDLSTYHQSMLVWGYKNVASSDVAVFTKQEVNYESGSWTYSPIRFWDKSADHYSFYAAAPALDAWSFSNGKLSYANFELEGISIAASTSINSAAVFPAASGDIDLMISHDITDYATYTSAAVNLEFDHILSRFNIGIKAEDLTNINIDLNELKVFNLVKKGSFIEASSDAVATGSIARWNAGDDKFETGVGFPADASGDALALTESMNYIYQALFIPQAAAYEDANLDGTGLSSTSAPYLKIKYTITDANASGDAGEQYTYYYNLADIFGLTSGNLYFYEGWQNTLRITVSPLAINFDADVYEWTTYASADAQIPE